MKKGLCLFLLFVCYQAITHAQYGWNLKENAVWNFADSLGLNFNSGIPDTMSSSVYQLSPNCIATVADAQGRMLFYTNSEVVWNRNGTVMPGGFLSSAAITLPNGTPFGEIDASSHGAQQGVLILPLISDPQKYYIFTLAGYTFDAGEPASKPFMWLTYSIVDMSQNGGLGAVVAGPYIIDKDLSTHMTAVPGDNCNIWLMVHEKRNPVFKAYEITAAGVNLTPVVSNAGYAPVTIPDLGTYCHGYGCMQVTPDRKRLAYTSPYQLMPEPYGGKTELFDFDAGTGIVSNALTLDSAYSWDMAVSSDNSKLYSATVINNIDDPVDFFYMILYQFDLSLPTPAAIVNSKTLIDTIRKPVATMPIRLAPDGKIYYVLSNSVHPADIDYLGIIHDPNSGGTACNHEQHGLLMPTRAAPDDNRSGIGCNGFVRPIPFDTLYSRKDTVLCNPGDSIRLRGPDAIYYTWNDGSIDTSLAIKEPGTYWVGSGISYCQYRVDTFVVAAPYYSLGNDTTICNQSSYTLSLPAGASQYRWPDGSTGNTYSVGSSGTYWVEAHKNNCIIRDTIRLQLKDLRQELGPDQVLCIGIPVQVPLSATLRTTTAKVLWSTGQTDISITVQDTGRYWLLVTDAPCSFSDSLHIGLTFCDCPARIPNAFSPNQDGLNDVFSILFATGCPVRHYQLSVYNRWGQRVFFSADPHKSWDGTWNGAPADPGTYMFHLTVRTGTRTEESYYKGDISLIR